MAGNKKPRKRYRPRLVYANAGELAMNSVTVLSAEEREQGCAAPERAQLAFEAGEDQAFNWSVMADALNVAEALAEVGICSDQGTKDVIARGQQVLAQLHGRIPCSLTPCDTLELSDAIERHRIQLMVCDYSEYRRAVEAVVRRTKAAMAGSPAKSTTMLEALPTASYHAGDL